MSSFVLFLIKYCLLPISTNDDKIIFKVFSWKTFIHCFISFGYLTLASVLILIVTSNEQDLENDYTDGGSSAKNFCFTWMEWSRMISLLFPLVISYGLTSLNSALIMKRDLRIPPMGYINIIGIINKIGVNISNIKLLNFLLAMFLMIIGYSYFNSMIWIRVLNTQVFCVLISLLQ